MKKITMLLVLALTMISCEKDNNSTSNNPCNCGLIVSDNAADYSVTVRNSCTENLKTFVLLPGDWMSAYVGSDICMEGQSKW
jgi:putative cell wall-binding protein